MTKYLFSLFILFASCGNRQTVDKPSIEEMKTLDLKAFKFMSPKNWTYIKTMGIDSYVGRIAIGGGDTLFFDYGRYRCSFGDKNQTTTYDTLDNRPVTIIQPLETGKGSIGFRFDSIDPNYTKLTIFGDSLDKANEVRFLNAVRTISFVSQN